MKDGINELNHFTQSVFNSKIVVISDMKPQAVFIDLLYHANIENIVAQSALSWSHCLYSVSPYE